MENIVTALFGIVCLVIGTLNRKGNISTLHSYHRNRVSEEDRIPFGKLIGLGTIIIGIALIAFSLFSYLATAKHDSFYLTVGYAVMGTGFVIGIGISFYAMFKYNKGIF